MLPMKEIWKTYEENMPKEIVAYLSLPTFQRLDDVSMHCGLEYTSFPFFSRLAHYSRYEHSVGVALICYHFTHDLHTSIAGLLHDISTPCFAHVIDFSNGDSLKQESTEKETEPFIYAHDDLLDVIFSQDMVVVDVGDYHLYPIADNDSPRLSADRLEYTLSNAVNFGFATLEEVSELYNDLSVVKAEDGFPELAFSSLEKASRFAKLALDCGKVYSSDEDRYAMQALSALLKSAIKEGVITKDDLYKSETALLLKLTKSDKYAKAWRNYRRLGKVYKTTEKINASSFKINAKRRYIDPLVIGKGRVSALNEELRKEGISFLSQSYDYWLTGGPLEERK